MVLDSDVINLAHTLKSWYKYSIFLPILLFAEYSFENAVPVQTCKKTMIYDFIYSKYLMWHALIAE